MDLKGRKEFPREWILICEDKPRHQFYFATILYELVDDELFLCNYAPDLPAAIAACRAMDKGAYAPYPLLALCDHDLPIGTGVELVSWLRRRYGAKPLIVGVSGIEANNRAMLEAGATVSCQKLDSYGMRLCISVAIKDYRATHAAESETVVI